MSANVRIVPENGNTHSWMTEWGVQLYFAARVAYLALYAAGVFLLRSLVWNAATPRIALVLLSFVGTMRLPSYMLTAKNQG